MEYHEFSYIAGLIVSVKYIGTCAGFFFFCEIPGILVLVV